MRLHIQTLQEYDGRGQCEEVVCYYATLKTYGDELRAWAARVDWAVNFYKYDEYMNMKEKKILIVFVALFFCTQKSFGQNKFYYLFSK